MYTRINPYLVIEYPKKDVHVIVDNVLKNEIMILTFS